MNFRLTGILIIFLAALGGVVWYSELRDKGSSDSTGAASDKTGQTQLQKFDDKDARQLVVVKGDQRVQVDRPDGTTWVLQPSGQNADSVRVSSVLFRLSSLQATKKVADAATDLSQYGLDAPPMSVTTTVADGTVYAVLLGSKSPTEAGTYARKADETTVYLVSSQLGTDLERLITDPPIERPTPTPAPIPPPPSPAASPEPAPTPGG
jgi:uncharacterized protein DUF4340